MNSFQILDANSNPIPMNIIDKEICAIWNKDVDPRSYANPAVQREGEKYTHFVLRSMGTNWFDVIGWSIANQSNYTSGWHNVALKILEDANQALVDEKLNAVVATQTLEAMIEACTPYLVVMRKFAALGWIPKQIKS